ncbi:MAG TPA: zf-HC2 domain-containing protein [Prolixibacteraceae bacterium]|nr:zf-HC2 domain-containing protein [Prolixibacteraceae bacterium]HPT30767.1 zf-HC2 domain-containing protein [Prolixibacteraceae bacterium]
MSHKRYKKNLVEYFEGSLPEEEMLQIRLHLEECPTCLRFADYLSDSLIVPGENRINEPDPFFFTRVSGRLTRGEDMTYRKMRIAHIWQPALITLLLMMAVIGGIGIGSIGKKNNFDRYAMENLDPWLNEMNSEPIESFLLEF